jgi:hypothetical protein
VAESPRREGTIVVIVAGRRDMRTLLERRLLSPPAGEPDPS